MAKGFINLSVCEIFDYRIVSDFERLLKWIVKQEEKRKLVSKKWQIVIVVVLRRDQEVAFEREWPTDDSDEQVNE